MVDHQELIDKEQEINRRETEKQQFIRDGNQLEDYLDKCFHGRKSPLPITEALKKDLQRTK